MLMIGFLIPWLTCDVDCRLLISEFKTRNSECESRMFGGGGILLIMLGSGGNKQFGINIAMVYFIFKF